MNKNPNLPDDGIQKAMKFAQTPAGKQLIALLEAQDKQALQDAVSKAASGDLGPVRKLIADLQASTEGKELMDQLGRK